MQRDKLDDLKNKSNPVLLISMLTLWPIVCSIALGLLLAAAISGWESEWPIVVHFGVVAISLTTAISNMVGFWISRSHEPGLLFVVMPATAFIIFLASMPLHYYLLNEYNNPQATGILVAILSILVTLFIIRLRIRNGC